MKHEFNNVDDIQPEQTGDHSNMVQQLTRYWDPAAIPDYRSALKATAALSDEDLLLALMRDQEIAQEEPLEDHDIVFVKPDHGNSEFEFFLTRPAELHA